METNTPSLTIAQAIFGLRTGNLSVDQYRLIMRDLRTQLSPEAYETAKLVASARVGR